MGKWLVVYGDDTELIVDADTEAEAVEIGSKEGVRAVRGWPNNTKKARMKKWLRREIKWCVDATRIRK